MPGTISTQATQDWFPCTTQYNDIYIINITLVKSFFSLFYFFSAAAPFRISGVTSK